MTRLCAWLALLGAAAALAGGTGVPAAAGADPAAREVYLLDLEMSRDEHRNSNRTERGAVQLGGRSYSRSISPPILGRTPRACVVFALPADAVALRATAGVPGSYNGSTTARFSFQGLKDGGWQRLNSGSGTLQKGSPPERVTVDLRGCSQLAVWTEGSRYRAPGTFWLGDPVVVRGPAR